MAVGCRPDGGVVSGVGGRRGRRGVVGGRALWLWLVPRSNCRTEGRSGPGRQLVAVARSRSTWTDGSAHSRARGATARSGRAGGAARRDAGWLCVEVSDGVGTGVMRRTCARARVSCDFLKGNETLRGRASARTPTARPRITRAAGGLGMDARGPPAGAGRDAGGDRRPSRRATRRRNGPPKKQVFSPLRRGVEAQRVVLHAALCVTLVISYRSTYAVGLGLNVGFHPKSCSTRRTTAGTNRRGSHASCGGVRPAAWGGWRHQTGQRRAPSTTRSGSAQGQAGGAEGRPAIVRARPVRLDQAKRPPSQATLNVLSARQVR